MASGSKDYGYPYLRDIMIKHITKYVFCFLLGLPFVLMGPTAADAQTNDDSVMLMRMYMQIAPGQRDAWVEGRQQQITHRREHGYSWGERVTISEDNVVRMSIRLPNGFSDIEARRAWFRDNPSDGNFANTVSRFWNELTRTRFELSYRPSGYEPNTTNFLQERRLYGAPGHGQALRDFMARVSSAFEEAGITQARFVSSGVMGGSPHYSIFYPAESAAAYYGSREALQPIFESLRGERTPGAVQRTVVRNWTRLRDLDFVPED